MEKSAKSPEPPAEARPSVTGGLADNIRRAYSMLVFANRHDITVPADVVAAVTGARQLAAGSDVIADHDAEAKFWNAYGLLSSIEPAYLARVHYKRTFYIWLGVMLVFQAHYLAATLVSNGLQGIEKEWQQPGENAPVGTGGTQAASGQEQWQSQNRQARACAYYRIANGLLLWTQGLDGCEDSIPAPATADPGAAAAAAAKRQMARVKVSTILDLVNFFASLCAGYLLPLIYGVLGAYAFVLRKLSEPLDTLNYGRNVPGSYTLRLPIGALAGLAVGWFVNGNQPIAGVASLSPVALAFAAGFGSDLLFATLDKIVGAFTPMPTSRTAERTESTVGGVTMTTATRRETHVAGAPDGSAATEKPAATASPVTVQTAPARDSQAPA
jgi:hypothetical protein